MAMTGKFAQVLALLAIGLSSFGCGRGDTPDLGTVKGIITLNGKPLPNVMVQFHSEAGGRPGSATTGNDGKYELKYTDAANGTVVGPSRVEISTIWPDGEPTPGETDKIPASYNSKSTLKFDVKKGSNTFDVDVKSAGGAAK